MVVNTWLECMDSEPGTLPCILVVGDSMSAIGWLFRSSKLESLPGVEHDAHLFVARHLATAVLKEHDACLASKHIKCKMNITTDLLSFSGTSERGKPHPLASTDPPNDILTQRFLDELTEQVPESFKISPLPDEILSFVTRALQIAASSLGAAKSPAARTMTGFGGDGKGSEKNYGNSNDPLLTLLSHHESEILSKAFLNCYRTARSLDASGRP